ncbi:Major Facilitator Superfamily [Geosmithia morbida]|uniref:Major Facilitator Superfamily n=1 Tax=Geosmithia morbida TaxID=1094350 RepID=A0A9P5CZE5_9HYPO|nr:Major Facilitator Superfamily [Geosmithia morbida]KAF4120392.1 Major Facilitator Superfamily [Geosmithia morbida]
MTVDRDQGPAIGGAISEVENNEGPDFCMNEKRHPGDDGRQQQQTIDENTRITYVYLTFDTELPSPHYSHPPTTEPPSPEPPKLAAYNSPLTWHPSRKGIVLALGCISTFLTAYCAGSYSPPSAIMAEDLHTTHTVSLVGITTFCMGFGLAPMVLAPVSEIWGRYPVLVMAEIISVIFLVACAVMNNIVGMLISRFMVGAGVSVFSSVVGGIMADLWHKEERNTPMALFSGSVLMGTGAGPLVAAAIVDQVEDPTQAWRWCFWHQVIGNVVLLAALVLFLSETRASVLLRRKAYVLNKWYVELEKSGVYGALLRERSNDPNDAADDCSLSSSSRISTDRTVLRRIRWKVQADEERASLGAMIAASSVRPFYMLVTEPVVFFFSLWAAFAWGILYLAFAVIPYLHAADFNACMRSYVAMIAGAAVATVVSIWQEDLLSHSKWRRVSEEDDDSDESPFWKFVRRHLPADAPEARLYFTCISGLFLPAGLLGAFLVPFTSDPEDEGTALAIGIGFATWGIYAVYLASFNYLADMYHVYASSALAANSFCRNMLGGSFPVVTRYMFDSMGVRGAGGMLGGLALALTVTPYVLVAWGSKIRSRSKMAMVRLFFPLQY